MLNPIILYIDGGRNSKLAKNLLESSDRFNEDLLIKSKTEKTTVFIYPAIQYGDKIISGLDGIIDVVSKSAKGNSLEDIFNFKKQYKTETSKVKEREKLALAFGFILGGMYLHVVGGLFAITSFIGVLIALIFPLILTVAWPHIWPSIKKELKNVRVRSLSDMGKD